jgi:hypothetical protein
MNWKWGAAVYTAPCFTTDYNAIAPLPGHGNSCVGVGGDRAGTPEGTSPTTGQPLKAWVIGGARGGGGSSGGLFVFGTILFFLFGLGIRNKFRLK